MMSNSEILARPPIYVGSWVSYFDNQQITDDTREANQWRYSILRHTLVESRRVMFHEDEKTTTSKLIFNVDGHQVLFAESKPANDKLQREIAAMNTLFRLYGFYADPFWRLKFITIFEVDSVHIIIRGLMRMLKLPVPTDDAIKRTLRLFPPPVDVVADNLRFRLLFSTDKPTM